MNINVYEFYGILRKIVGRRIDRKGLSELEISVNKRVVRFSGRNGVLVVVPSRGGYQVLESRYGPERN